MSDFKPGSLEKPLTVIGLMSGTSVDAIDACAVRLWMVEEKLHYEMLGTYTHAIPDHLLRRIGVAEPQVARRCLAIDRPFRAGVEGDAFEVEGTGQQCRGAQPGTPVPGGVGPMTRAMLLANTVAAFSLGALVWLVVPLLEDGRLYQLVRQRDALKTILGWYVLPFVPGLTLVIAGNGLDPEVEAAGPPIRWKKEVGIGYAMPPEATKSTTRK